MLPTAPWPLRGRLQPSQNEVVQCGGEIVDGMISTLVVLSKGVDQELVTHFTASTITTDQLLSYAFYRLSVLHRWELSLQHGPVSKAHAPTATFKLLMQSQYCSCITVPRPSSSRKFGPALWVVIIVMRIILIVGIILIIVLIGIILVLLERIYVC